MYLKYPSGKEYMKYLDGGGGETWKVTGWTVYLSISFKQTSQIYYSSGSMKLPVGAMDDISDVSVDSGSV